jgi:hypothetical protein
VKIDQQAATTVYLRQVGMTPRTGTTAQLLPEPTTAPEPTPTPTVYAQLDQEHLRALLAEHVSPGSRSERLYHLIGVCKRSGLTQGQAVAALEPWCAMVSQNDGKYTGKAAYHVRLSWPKIPDRQHDPYLDQRDTTTSLLALVHQDQASDTSGEPIGGNAPNTWQPVDLTDVLDGTYEPEVPDLLPREDGLGLLYRGRVHSIHAESESGKSLVVQAETARLLNAGERVAYLDFESDAASVVRRLLDLGADPEAVRSRFDYRRPEVAPAPGTPERAAWLGLLTGRCALVVLDGVTEAMDVLAPRGSGVDLNERIAGWLRGYPVRLANNTGAAVVLIDHVVKNAESRGRHAIGGQHKMAGLTGAAYTVEVKDQPRRGHVGVLHLRIAKDRPGSIRAQCGQMRATDRTQLASVVRIDSTGDRIAVTMASPGAEAETSATFRPTYLMERVSRWLQAHAGQHSRSAVTKAVKGNKAALETALDVLSDEGYATVSETLRGSITQRNYAHKRLYTEAEELADPKPVQPVLNRSNTSPRTSVPKPVQPVPPPTRGTGLQDRSGPATQPRQTGPVLVRDVDVPKLLPCATCGQPLSASALQCSSCGEPVEAPF